MADAATTSIDPSQSTLSANFAPYVYDMLARGQAAASQPFQEYTGQRFAGPSALQQQAFQGIGSLALPGQFQTATDFLTQAGQRAGQFAYNPLQVSAPNLAQYQLQAPQAVQGAQAQAAQLQNAPTAQAAQTGFNPNLQTFQMGPVQQVGTSTFTPQSAAGLMSPYMQNVVDVQQREAQRQADIARGARGAQFAKYGAFGGARQAIENAEAARNLQTQLGGIQAQGLQSAYQQAQQQFNTQQQAALQAALANQQAGLTAGGQNLAAALGVQQLGTQTGLQAALANQQAQQQAALANQQLAGQYGLQQGQFGQQAAIQNAQMAQQAALANQQAGLTAGQQNLQALLGVQQLGAGQNLQAQLANQAAQQAGAGLGLQALQQQTGAGTALGGLGQGQTWAQMQGLNALLGAGGIQQQLNQQPFDFGYQQYQQSLQYPYQQATFMQSLLGGLPLQAAPYSSGATGFGSALQGGLAGLGMYNALFGGK